MKIFNKFYVLLYLKSYRIWDIMGEYWIDMWLWYRVKCLNRDNGGGVFSGNKNVLYFVI